VSQGLYQSDDGDGLDGLKNGRGKLVFGMQQGGGSGNWTDLKYFENCVVFLFHCLNSSVRC